MKNTKQELPKQSWSAKWVKPIRDMGDIAPVYCKQFQTARPIKSCILYITAMGVYEAELNGRRIGNFFMAPGWTAYAKRLQYQQYDVTEMLKEHNEFIITVGKGWYHSHMILWDAATRIHEITETPLGLLAQLVITYENGQEEVIGTDETWSVSEGAVRFAEIYDGEVYDANIVPEFSESVEVFEGPWDTLIPQEGEIVCTHEQVKAATIFTTPKGETIIDFGQEVTGYPRLSVEAKKGDVVDISFGEVLDKGGNFYNENYRKAKCHYHYICRDGQQTYEPQHTFYGFRYIRINTFPGGVEAVGLDNFTAVVVHSDIRRTGYVTCSDPLLSRLFDNVIWGQKGNFLDVPTDCPQRNERLGWTGDIQVFIRAACLNYDVERFMAKWLSDLKADQLENGLVPAIIPDVLTHWADGGMGGGSAWGDAATVCPWQVYLAYGNAEILEKQYESMCKWISYITTHTEKPYLWIGCDREQHGDWLALDENTGDLNHDLKGKTRTDFIASAFYAYSTSLVIKAGNVLGKDVVAYEELYENIVSAFRKAYPTYLTQTECILAAYFDLAEEKQAAADQLAELIKACGNHLQTGFVGTPYLLHVLSDYGYEELAYTLLLRQEYPSWLYSVKKSATTIWEHWDGIKEDGEFWAVSMNSFNHYAYGSVIDWVYTKAAGIQIIEEYPAYEKVRIAPVPDKRLEWLKAELDTRHGHISSRWNRQDDLWRYEITTPVEAEIVIDGKTQSVAPGSYCFYSRCEITPDNGEVSVVSNNKE